jgi:hypothetical protein
MRLDNNILRITQRIMRESKELVPKKTGYLLSTAYIRKAGGIGYEFGYSANYALAVHEIPPPGNHASNIVGRSTSGGLGGMRTAWHHPPTSWKYLEIPYRKHAQGMERLLLQGESFKSLDWLIH